MTQKLLKDMTELELGEHLSKQLRFIRSCRTSDTVEALLVIFGDDGITQYGAIIFGDDGITQYGATVDPEPAAQALRELADRIEKRQTVRRRG